MPNELVEALRRSDSHPRARLVPYLLVDRARIRRTRALARAAREAGADALELGFPFSDPIADGPTLQAASTRALRHGTTWQDLLGAVHAASEELPCAVMTYANPVYRHGMEEAMRAIGRAGGSGVILPDVAWEESTPWHRAAHAAGLALVQMAAPGTSVLRTDRLVRTSEAFLYLVSRYGVTGATGFVARPELAQIVTEAHRVRPGLPVLVGFGIRSAHDAREVRRTRADGVIVGSAFESAIERSPTPARVRSFLDPIVRALQENVRP